MNAKAVVAAVIALGCSAGVLACILADPPPIVNPPPQEAPEIQTLSVTPPLSQILKTNPPCTNAPTDCFVVPVLVDPNATVKWRVFIDLDETGLGTQSEAISATDDGGVLGVTSEAGPSIRTFSFSLTQTPLFDPTVCHTITFIVAYDFFDSQGDFWKPLPPGLGSSATWFYQPVDDCTFYDAGGTD